MSQSPLPSPPIRYTGSDTANVDYHDGQLRPVIGVHSVQVLRANRAHPDWAEGWGWTYNHAPMLAYWNGQFYLEYLSNPVSEHTPPGQTLLTRSPDGIHWQPPQVVFPIYRVPDGIYQAPEGYALPPGSDAVMHQRMGFYCAPNGRLLVLGFYGICPTPHIFPNDGRGIGRVVREIYPDGSLSPIYFVRYNRHAGWNQSNTLYPFYQTASDAGFIAACEALLADRLATLQWWEEDRSPDGFYAVQGGRALSYYHLPDGRVVGLWKESKTAISADEGASWSPVTTAASLVMSGAKVWGQRTSDGRYALVYNPNPEGIHRWPLGIVTGTDGLEFDGLSLVEGEVPPRRFLGLMKDFGLNYVRGIEENCSQPPDGALWVAYSMNKEDIWISRIPIPVNSRAQAPLADTFNDLPPGSLPSGWNIYSPRWAPVSVADFPGNGSRSLRLEDRDPCDYARAARVFPESTQALITLRVLAEQADRGQLFIELTDGKGSAAVRLMFDADGWIKARDGGRWNRLRPRKAGEWVLIQVRFDAPAHNYWLSINGESILQEDSSSRNLSNPSTENRFAASVRSLERLVLRTGPRRWTPTPDTWRDDVPDVPGADEPLEPAVFYINTVSSSEHVPARIVHEEGV